MKIKSLKEFSNLQEDIKPYNILLLTHSEATVRDTKSDPGDSGSKLLQDIAKNLDIKVYMADFVGLEIDKTSTGHTLKAFTFNSNAAVQLPDSKGVVEYQKPIKIDPANTIIMPRGIGTLGFTGSRNWYDMMSMLELEGYFVLNSMKCFDMCNSKYMSYLKFLHHKIRTPKTVAITHSETVEDSFKKLKTDFPVILKSSTGTQTGVGVVVVESLRSLKALVQMTLLYNKYLPIIIQEYIKTDWDIRVLVCEGKVIAAMKRIVMSDDVRSNASMGADTETLELTELEKSESIRIAEEFGGRVVGVDLIPAKDRENELPYCLEINANPGLNGIEEITKGSPTKNILETYKDRSIWPVLTP
tara:strand:- start:538 stop:1611 length:1074 start_codon:yes stop_codon:yes gene_type:complete